jgi:hypothetical protein
MPENFSLRRLLWAGPLIILLANLVDLLFYAGTRLLGERYLITINGPTRPAVPMPVLSIVLAASVAVMGASLIFAGLLKVTHVPLPPFLSISAAALLVSFGGPFSLAGVTTLMTKLLLCTMIVLTAVTVVGGLVFLARRK